MKQNNHSHGCMCMLQALGQFPYPWEEAIPQSIVDRLGFFRPMLLQMLSRDPTKRPLLRDVYHEWSSSLKYGPVRDAHMCT
jgi:hypothetical protein